MRNFYLASVIAILTLFGSRTIVMAVDDTPAEDPMTLLQSTDLEDRHKALQMIAKERLRVVEGLLEIVRSPREAEDDLWLDQSSPRNMAIKMLGQMRVSDPVVFEVLANHLERPDGEETPLTSDGIFTVCPAAIAFVSIGEPSTDKMIEIMATTPDVQRMRANQAHQILYDVEGQAEGDRLLTQAIKDEQDPERQQALQAHLEVFRTFRK